LHIWISRGGSLIVLMPGDPVTERNKTRQVSPRLSQAKEKPAVKKAAKQSVVKKKGAVRKKKKAEPALAAIFYVGKSAAPDSR
jgi:hypothetical protein